MHSTRNYYIYMCVFVYQKMLLTLPLPAHATPRNVRHQIHHFRLLCVFVCIKIVPSQSICCIRKYIRLSRVSVYQNTQHLPPPCLIYKSASSLKAPKEQTSNTCQGIKREPLWEPTKGGIRERHKVEVE